MNTTSLRPTVVAALDEVCGLDADSLVDGATLGDLGIDSLDLLEVAMIVEQETGVVVQAEDFDGVETLAAAVAVFDRLHHDAD